MRPTNSTPGTSAIPIHGIRNFFQNYRFPSPRVGDFKKPDRPQIVEAFENAFENMIAKRHMIDTLERTQYFAEGCDSQKHRGPSYFAMLLAFGGCSAREATDVANAIWKLNGVPGDFRLEIANGRNASETCTPTRVRAYKRFCRKTHLSGTRSPTQRAMPHPTGSGSRPKSAISRSAKSELRVLKTGASNSMRAQPTTP